MIENSFNALIIKLALQSLFEHIFNAENLYAFKYKNSLYSFTLKKKKKIDSKNSNKIKINNKDSKFK